VGSLLTKIPVIGSMFETPEFPAAPNVEPPKVMPEPDDAKRQQARRQSLSRQSQRQGRASTIFTSGLGG
jgi:hypothetical protein